MDIPVLPSGYARPRWYAAYTLARHEKCVAEQFRQRNIDHFLPLYETMQRWKDRRARVQLPLFPSYVFVHIPLRERVRILELPSVVRLVGFNGTATPLEDEEVESMQQALAQGLHAEPHPFLTVGRRVRVIAGPLTGHEGILVRRKGNVHVVLSIGLIQRSVLVQIEAASLEPLI